MYCLFLYSGEKKLQENIATDLGHKTIKHKRHTSVVIAWTAVLSAITCWQKKKKQQQQACAVLINRHGADGNLLFFLPLVFLELEGR